MISFTTTIMKFGGQGEKTGWTYISIPANIAVQLQPDHKKSFRVKGKLDAHSINGVALVPMGGGDYIMALNADLRKALGKRKGATLNVQLTVDTLPYQIDKALLDCLEDEPAALLYFKSLPLAHQHYYSKWVESAKTEPTKVKRISRAVTALERKMGYPEMIRANKSEKDVLG